MNKYVVGQVFEDMYGDEVAWIVHANGEWMGEAHRDDYLEEFGELPDPTTPILFEESASGEFFEGNEAIQEAISDYNLIDIEDRKRKDEERQYIVDTLKSLGVNTNDLIVSEGRVYMGYNECENYIQGTHAWCSSSMSC